MPISGSYELPRLHPLQPLAIEGIATSCNLLQRGAPWIPRTIGEAAMATDLQSRWGEDPHPVLRLVYGALRAVGRVLRLTAFSVLTLFAPFIRVGLVLGAAGILFVCLVATGRPHTHPFPYREGIALAATCAVLRVLFDWLLRVLEP